MIVVVNGKDQELPAGTSVRALIEQMGLGKQACAAEVNRQLVPRREQDGRELKEGDRVELVSLVGGG
jgi:thiamine biosynthesis protein ThiS